MTVGADVVAHLRAALDLAALGRFRVEPNPGVGAIVLSAAGDVVGRGHHAAWGGDHAEVVALREAGEAARGGTLIVTLEPCAHDAKKTPPCAPRVTAAGVRRVIAGTADPNPATRGRAAAHFAAHGIAYECGVLDDACRAAIARSTAHLARRRPWTIAKWAMSLDGRIADARGASRWISGTASRAIVHDLRRRVDAIVVGRGTVDADDPALVAEGAARPALRVVLDSDLRVSPASRVIASASATPTLVIAGAGADAARRGAIEATGAAVAEVARGTDGRADAAAAFAELHARGVRRALLEAGGTLQASALRAGVVDQVAAFVAPIVIGGTGPAPFVGDGWSIADPPRLEDARVTGVGADALIEGFWPARTADTIVDAR